MFKFLLYKLGQFVVNLLPLQLAYSFAAFVSRIQYYFSFRDRKAVQKNLQAICGSLADVRSLSYDVFINMGKYLVEFFKMNTKIDEEYIRENVRLRGFEHIDGAVKRKKGVILVTAHIGNWELGAVILSVLGYPSMAVALPHKERPVNDLFNRQREMKGLTVVPPSSAVRRCMEHLRNGGLIALVADRDFSAHGIEMEFLGRKTMIPRGAAMFSVATGAPIVPTFLIRQETGKFEFSCYEPIIPPDQAESANEEEKIRGVIRQYLNVIEQQIRQYPSQWLLFREFGQQ